MQPGTWHTAACSLPGAACAPSPPEMQLPCIASRSQLRARMAAERRALTTRWFVVASDPRSSDWLRAAMHTKAGL